MKAKWLALMMTGLLLAPSGSTWGSEWEIYQGHKYTLTLNSAIWLDAEAEAVAAGGHLVTINDRAENDWLTTTFANASPHHIAWIGFYQDLSLHWRWISGEPVTFSETSYTSWPQGGIHAYLHTADHPFPGTWNANTMHDSPDNPGAQPPGIIEVVLPPEPPVADANGPYTINVTDTLTLDASGSTDINEDITSYTWDLDDNGAFETDAGSDAVFPVSYSHLQSLGLGVGGPYDIHLQVTDSLGQQHVAGGTLTIIPEPATLALLALGAVALLHRKR